MLVDPMFIYWIGVFDTLRTVAIALSVLSGFFFIVTIIILLVKLFADETRLANILSVIISSLVFLILLSGAIFVPSKETMIGMAIAKVATTENIKEAYKFTKDEIKELITFTVNTINGSITNTLDHLPIKADININKE